MNWGLRFFKKSTFLVTQLGKAASKDTAEPENVRNSRSDVTNDANFSKNTLLEILHSDIIPRLATDKEKCTLHSAENAMSEFTPTAHMITEFALLCVNPDLSKAEAYVQNLLDSAHSTESIYLNLFAPSARYLGTLWEEDDCDFVQVTLGLMQLQTITRKLGNSLRDRYSLGEPRPRALFAPLPGSQHTLGVLMVSEFFRKEGWQVWMELAPNESDLLSTLTDEWFDVVGLSIGTDAQLDELSTLIDRLRQTSHNPSVFVMIGGPAIYERINIEKEVGADAFATDASKALELARELLATST